MIKKCSKILITILFVFLVSLIATSSVNAKEMTLDELSEAIMDYDSNTADFYMFDSPEPDEDGYYNHKMYLSDNHMFDYPVHQD